MARVEAVSTTGATPLKAGTDPVKAAGEEEEAFEKVVAIGRVAGEAKGSSRGEVAVTRG